MRHIITKAQVLGQKAAELRQVVHGLPGHAARLREAVTMTGGELHQLRAEVQGSLGALRADDEERLLKTMREVSDHAAVFAEAGYRLRGLDLDMALNHRLAVQLDKVADVPHADLRSLLARPSADTVRSILAGIVKAEETAANVELSALAYVGLVVHAGPLPTIRMQWRELAGPPAPAELPAPSIASNPGPAPSSASLGSIFEPRPIPSQTARPVAAESSEPPSPAAPAAAVPPKNSWSSDALARFKQMPGASKYGR